MEAAQRPANDPFTNLTRVDFVTEVPDSILFMDLDGLLFDDYDIWIFVLERVLTAQLIFSSDDCINY